MSKEMSQIPIQSGKSRYTGKTLILTILFAIVLPFAKINAQGIGELAPPKPLEVFPKSAWGMDIMFGDAGFGLGTFFRKQLNVKWTAFADLSFSETKDDREIEYYDYYEQKFVTLSKVNRIFQMPINVGVQYRLFENDLTDNLRPYLVAGVGPTMLITTPYELEFFNSFGKAKAKLAAGGYIGLGANFGLDKSSLVGITFKYYYAKILNGGVESLKDRKKTEIQGFFITLNLGLMY
jgi:hypothetical protein